MERRKSIQKRGATVRSEGFRRLPREGTSRWNEERQWQINRLAGVTSTIQDEGERSRKLMMDPRESFSSTFFDLRRPHDSTNVCSIRWQNSIFSTFHPRVSLHPLINFFFLVHAVRVSEQRRNFYLRIHER